MDCRKQKAPRAQSGPINAVWRLGSQLPQFIAANNVIRLLADLLQPDRQLNELTANSRVEITPAAPAGSSAFVEPRYEEGITNARMQHGCTREKPVGESLVDEKEADLVARVLLTTSPGTLDLAHL